MVINIFKTTPTIDFVGIRRWAGAISLVILLAGLAAVVMQGGLRYGVDFAGGVTAQIVFDHPIADEDVKAALADVDMLGLTIQKTGTDDREYMLRFSAQEEGAGARLRAELEDALASRLSDNHATIQSLDMVGPKVGKDLRDMAVEALFYSVLLISVYISGRFEHTWVKAGLMAAVMWGLVFLVGWLGFSRIWGVALAMAAVVFLSWKLKLNFALGAIVSLLHDVFVTMGFLMIMGKEIDLNIIAALLTIVGYSLNDTIIVFDRIRENLRNMTPDEAARSNGRMGDVINLSINQTLSRTILTSGTTLMTCFALYLLGGSVIHDFSLTILVGVAVGTYSSIFIASPVLMLFGDVEQYTQAQKTGEPYERPGEHGIV